MILLDTSVLSLAFRRPRRADAQPSEARRLAELVERDEPLCIPGICLQELLSGVATEAQFTRLQRLLEPFPLLLATRDLHHAAARIHAACRRAGVATTSADCLIAATAIEARGQLFTADKDFARMRAHCALVLFDS